VASLLIAQARVKRGAHLRAIKDDVTSAKATAAALTARCDTWSEDDRLFPTFRLLLALP
jgi:hypothetical protein